MLRLVVRLTRLVVLLLAICLACAAILALGGRWNAWLDVLAHFAIPFCAGGAALTLAALAAGGRTRWPAAAAGLLSILASLGLMAPEAIASRGGAEAHASGGPVLRLVQFNLWRDNHDPQGALDWILAQHADVVVVEEAIEKASLIRQGLIQAYPNHSACDPSHPCGVVVFSRLPMAAHGSLRGPPATWARLIWNDRTVTVVGAHYYWPMPPSAQRRQRRHMARWLQDQDQANAIMAGDFNSTPWSFGLRSLDEQIELRRRTHGLPTWPAQAFGPGIPAIAPFLPIDQVYAGAAWRTVRIRRGPRLGSDHYPVVVELAPN